MLEQLLKFITPGPLTEEFEFRLRVFTSWISLGLILGPIIGVIALNSGAAAPDGALVLVLQYLIGTPIVFCIFGLIGLGLDSYQGDAEHYGWYWWLFPIIIYIATGFWLAILLLGSIFGFAGIRIPRTPRRHQSRRKGSPNERVVNDWFNKNAAKSSTNFVRENPRFKPQNRQEEAVYQEILQNPEKTIEEITSEMSEEEFEAFIEMLMRMLGFTFLS